MPEKSPKKPKIVSLKFDRTNRGALGRENVVVGKGSVTSIEYADLFPDHYTIIQGEVTYCIHASLVLHAIVKPPAPRKRNDMKKKGKWDFPKPEPLVTRKSAGNTDEPQIVSSKILRRISRSVRAAPG